MIQIDADGYDIICVSFLPGSNQNFTILTHQFTTLAVGKVHQVNDSYFYRLINLNIHTLSFCVRNLVQLVDAGHREKDSCLEVFFVILFIHALL